MFKKPLLFICLVLIAAGCDTAYSPLHVSATPPAAIATLEAQLPAPETAPHPHPPPGGEYAEVIEVYDGDTIRVRIEGNSFKVRYIGINAPEIGENEQPFGREAAELNRQLVEDRTVYLVRDVSDTDRYDRLLRYVFVEGVFVNVELVRAGLARARDYPPDTLYSDILFAAQDEARAGGLGLWGP